MIVRTTNFTNQTMLGNVIDQQNKLFDAYGKITSNKKFTNISENPIDSSALIGINNQLTKIETYKKNISNASTQLKAQDDVFSSIVKKMDRINELAIGAANGASGENGIEAAKTEIEELKKSIVALANTKYNDMYIFAGENVTTPPYSYDEATGNITFSGTPSSDPNYQRKIEIADGVKIGLNAAGDSVFGMYDAADPTNPDVSNGLFKVLGDLTTALNDQDGDKIRAELDNIQSAMKNVSEIQSIFSSSVSKLTMTETTLDDTNLTLKSQQQNLQEIDQATAISDWVKQNYAYQASMQVFMQMQNNSLMNYM